MIQSHPEADRLKKVEWLIFGHVSFNKYLSCDWGILEPVARWLRKRKMAGLTLSLARFCKIRTKNLVIFQNYEIEPVTRFHHVHLLIGRSGVSKPSTEIIDFLSTSCSKYGFGKCLFTPYDDSKKGIEYVTKIVYCYRTKQELQPDFYFSSALLRKEAR